MLVEQIQRAQQGDSRAMEALILKFDPILKKYSRKLFWEDAYQDLVLAFLELIHGIKLDTLRSTDDGRVVNYIAQSVRHSYIRLLNLYFSQPQLAASVDEATEAQKLLALAHEDKREKQAFFDLLDGCPSLTKRERHVLTEIYYFGFTAVEIARGMGTTKQNINQIKRRALEKLRKQEEST